MYMMNGSLSLEDAYATTFFDRKHMMEIVGKLKKEGLS